MPKILNFILFTLLTYTISANSEEQTLPPEVERKANLENLLVDKDYRGIEKQLASCIDNSIISGKQETDCYSHVLSFNRIDNSLKLKLQDWVEAEPDNYIALINLANMTYDMAYIKRGGGYKKHTHPEDMDAFKVDIEQAIPLLIKATKIRPDLPYAWASLVAMDGRINGCCSTGDSNDYYRNGLAAVPHSYIIRDNFMTVRWPRWGGTHFDVNDIFEKSRPYWTKNPFLKTLESRVLYAEGYDYFTGLDPVKQNSEKALSYFNKAAEISPDDVGIELKILTLKLRADNTDQSDIDRIVQLYQAKPFAEERYQLLAQVLKQYKNQTGLLNITAYQARLNPDDYGIQKSYSYQLASMGHFEESEKVISMAIDSRPYDFYLNNLLSIVQESQGKTSIPIIENKKFLINLASYHFLQGSKLTHEYYYSIKKKLPKLTDAQGNQIKNDIKSWDYRRKIRQLVADNWEQDLLDIPAEGWFALSTYIANEEYCACYLRQETIDEHLELLKTKQGKIWLNQINTSFRKFYLAFITEELAV